MTEYILKCPHCHLYVLIHHNDLNCRIFRHGVLKNNNEQIPPHLHKEECDRLYTENLIYGCGKPFRVNGEGNHISIEICDYI